MIQHYCAVLTHIIMRNENINCYHIIIVSVDNKHRYCRSNFRLQPARGELDTYFEKVRYDQIISLESSHWLMVLIWRKNQDRPGIQREDEPQPFQRFTPSTPSTPGRASRPGEGSITRTNHSTTGPSTMRWSCSIF